MKNCMHCGCVNDSVNRYCRNCGTRFAEEVSEKQQAEAAPAKADLIFGATEKAVWGQDFRGEESTFAVKLNEGQPLQEVPELSDSPQHTSPVIDFDFMDQKEPPREEPVELAPFPFGQRESDISAVIQTLKRSGASLGTFWFCLFFTVYLGLAIWSAIVSLDSYEVNLVVMGYEQSTPALDQSVITGLLMGGKLLWLVPSLLTMIGMWLFYGACLNRKRPYVKTSGLGVVCSGAIVLICLLGICGLYGIVSIAIYTQWIAQLEGGDSAPIIVLVLAVLVLIAAVALRLIYSAKLIRLIRRVRHTAATGEADAKVSVYIIVMNFLSIFGGAPLVGVYIAAGDFIQMGGVIARMLALIFISVVLLRYKEGMKNIIYRKEHPLPDKMELSDRMGM